MASITFIKGDLLKAFQDRKERNIVHGCNCFHTMGNGIAKQISQAYPKVLEIDKQMSVEGDTEKLGSFTKYRFKDGGTSSVYNIYNLYSQYTYWGKGPLVEWDAVSQGLFEIIYDHSFTEKTKHVTLALPLIGCGLAGGNKKDLLTILCDVSKCCRDDGIQVYFRLYELE